MILEVLDARTGAVATRQRPGLQPLTIGRALDNDLVLDDPWVDAHHARIIVTGEHALIEDLGSTNALLLAGDATRHRQLPLTPGTELRIGRTRLRIRDDAEPVPAALPDAATHREPGAQWLHNPRAQLLISAGAVAAFALFMWLQSHERSSASEVVGGALGWLFIGALWAGVWAVASRIIVQRFHFLGHFAVASAGVLLAFAWMVLASWLSFFLPGNPLETGLGVIAFLTLFAALLAWHLALASQLPPLRRWQIGAIAGTALFAIGVVISLAEDDSFSAVPEIASVLQPVAARWVPTMTVQEFARVGDELRSEVDELAERQRARNAPGE